jgi:hypothetical protein
MTREPGATARLRRDNGFSGGADGVYESLIRAHRGLGDDIRTQRQTSSGAEPARCSEPRARVIAAATTSGSPTDVHHGGGS